METLERICRVCLNSETQEEFHPIFDSDSNSIALKIFLISSVKVFEFNEFNMPALICPTCMKDLYKCCLFRKRCQEADEFFKNKTSKIECGQWKLDDEYDRKISLCNIKLEPDAIKLNTEELLIDQFNEPENEWNDHDQDNLYYTITPVPSRRGTKPKSYASRRKTPLNCRYCGVTVSRRNRLEQHERLHFIENFEQYSCAICNQKFNQKFGIIPHFRKAHGFRQGPKEKWKCAICPNKILPPGNLVLHYQNCHATLVQEIGTSSMGQSAGLKFPLEKPTRLKGNRRNRTERQKRTPKDPNEIIKFIPCQICGRSFRDSSRFMKHMKQYHSTLDEQILMNKIQENENITKLETNIENCNGDAALRIEPSQKVPCTTCGKVFASITTCKAHEKTHLNISYNCDLCASSFRVKAYLVSHMQKVHLKLKKFTCPYCPASYVHREQLTYHVKKHLNIRDYACKYCGKTFVTRNCVLSHERIHTDERPFECKYCDRRFIHHSDHRRHELRHIGNQKKNTENSEQFMRL